MVRMNHLLLASACAIAASGCATFCSLSDTGMSRVEPYGGIRGTLTNWDGNGEKPWDSVDSPVAKTACKLYFRTVDLPMSLVADTYMLPFTLLISSSRAEREATPTDSAKSR